MREHVGVWNYKSKRFNKCLNFMWTRDYISPINIRYTHIKHYNPSANYTRQAMSETVLACSFPATIPLLSWLLCGLQCLDKGRHGSPALPANHTTIKTHRLKVHSGYSDLCLCIIYYIQAMILKGNHTYSHVLFKPISRNICTSTLSYNSNLVKM